MSATPSDDRGNAKRDPDSTLTILHSRSAADVPRLQADLLGTDIRLADLFLRLAQETAVARHARSQLLSVISDFTFQAFPQATHLVLVTQDPEDGKMKPLIAESREGQKPTVALSNTLVDKVMSEEVSVVFSETETPAASESIVASGINTAICAPLSSVEGTFGIMQLDIRGTRKGNFTKKDVDRITVFAHHVALVLDNYRMHLEGRRAFESTINALVHSLSLKDPATASHSCRVRDVAVHVGLLLDLTEEQLESLSMAALLHDMGKHGIRDEVLLKPGRLTDLERKEMANHSELTQTILDKIAYPSHLKDVPRLAAFHHEKMDGTGPYGLTGDEIPIQSRIIAVADVFDALVSARVYKKPMPPEQALAILDQGKNIEFDPLVVDTIRGSLSRILDAVYSGGQGAADLAA